jgi:hypothetical protein
VAGFVALVGLAVVGLIMVVAFPLGYFLPAVIMKWVIEHWPW